MARAVQNASHGQRASRALCARSWRRSDSPRRPSHPRRRRRPTRCFAASSRTSPATISRCAIKRVRPSVSRWSPRRSTSSNPTARPSRSTGCLPARTSRSSTTGQFSWSRTASRTSDSMRRAVRAASSRIDGHAFGDSFLRWAISARVSAAVSRPIALVLYVALSIEPSGRTMKSAGCRNGSSSSWA